MVTKKTDQMLCIALCDQMSCNQIDRRSLNILYVVVSPIMSDHSVKLSIRLRF